MLFNDIDLGHAIFYFQQQLNPIYLKYSGRELSTSIRYYQCQIKIL